VAALVPQLFQIDHPAYLRLGLSELPAGVAAPPYAPWRRLLQGETGVAVAVGPLAGGLWEHCRELPPEGRPAVWLVSELPPAELPADFLADLDVTGRLLVVEEHVAQGGLGQMLASLLLHQSKAPPWFRVRAALGYPSGRFGSQQFHRRECGLDPASALAPLLKVAVGGLT